MATAQDLQTIKNPPGFDGLAAVTDIINAMPDSDNKQELLNTLSRAETGNGWALNDLAYWMINADMGFEAPDTHYNTIYDLYRQAALAGTPNALESATFVRDKFIDFNVFSELHAPQAAIDPEEAAKAEAASLSKHWQSQHERRFEGVDWAVYREDKALKEADVLSQQQKNINYYAAVASSEGIEGLATPFLKSMIETRKASGFGPLSDLNFRYQETALKKQEVLATMDSIHKVSESIDNEGHKLKGLFNRIRNGNLSFDNGNYREIFAGHTAPRTSVPETMGAVFETTLKWDPQKMQVVYEKGDNFKAIDAMDMEQAQIEPGDVIELQFAIEGMENQGVRSYRFVIPDQGKLGVISAQDLLGEINSGTMAGLERDIAQIVMEETIYALDIAQNEAKSLILNEPHGQRMLAATQNAIGQQASINTPNMGG